MQYSFRSLREIIIASCHYIQYSFILLRKTQLHFTTYTIASYYNWHITTYSIVLYYYLPHIASYYTQRVLCNAFLLGYYSTVSYWSESSDKEQVIPPPVSYVFWWPVTESQLDTTFFAWSKAQVEFTTHNNVRRAV